jgi:hypothetical protein
MNDNLLKAILKDSGESIASGSDLRELKDAQKRYDIALDGVTQYNRDNAHKDWASHKDDLVKAIKDGGDFRNLPALTYDQFLAEYNVRQEAYRESLRKICQEILPLCDKICTRFMAIATEKAADMANAELKAHSKFGLTHKPSALCIAFGKAAEYARNRCPKSMYAAYGPKQLLPMLDI